jgi:hypothetical protein
MRPFLFAAMLISVAGCQNDKPSTMRERQNAALNDPWHYSPYEDPNDISGGGVTDFKSGAFKRDVNSVFSP